MAGRRTTVWCAVGLAAVASVGLAWIGIGRDAPPRSSLGGNRYLMGLALGGFRAPLASFHWLKVDLDFRKGHYFDTARNLRMVAALNPRGRDRRGDSVWDYGAWHLAFNVSSRVDDPAKSARYVLQGLDLAREGLRHLPTSASLHRTISAICLFRGTAHRAAFLAAEGREPEAIAFEAYGRLLGRPEAAWIDLALFAEAALAYAERLLIAGRFDTAQNVLAERVEKLDLALRLGEEGKAPADEMAQLRRERRTADKWIAVATTAARGDFESALDLLAVLRSSLVIEALLPAWGAVLTRPFGIESDDLAFHEVENWVRRIHSVSLAMERRRRSDGRK